MNTERLNEPRKALWAIADRLCDALIAAQSERIDALKTHKRGLMQGLFSGPEALGA